jgi:protein-S-isoprenylcysteine O-methyltransferase Ste14
LTKETFSKGPYRFTSTPTNFGLFFLMLGFGMVANSFFIMTCSCVAFIIARFVFLTQEEKVLAEKYGRPYLEYKKMVKF